MINILYIAYQFPPLNVGGSARPAKFANHLKDFGVHTTIVTLHPDDFEKVYANAKVDSDLLKYSDVKILPVHSEPLLENQKNRFKKFITIFFNKHRSSEKKFWSKHYEKAVGDFLKQNEIQVIVATAPPFGVLSLAAKTSKDYNIPLIVDMRDPWTMWTTSPYPNYYTFLASKRAERKIFNQASKIIATSKVTLEDFKTLHPSIDKDKFVYIPNGFDHDIDFNDIVYTPSNTITIGYVGSFYYDPKSRIEIMTPWYQKKAHRILQYVPRKEDWLYRSPYYFFKSLQTMFQLDPTLKERVSVKFAGNKADWFDDMVTEFNLEQNIQHLGWMSHTESLELQKSCDFLLITSAKVLGGKDYSIAGKTFEYFTIQKPILAYVADGAQKDVLEQSNLAHFLSIENATSAAEKLKIILTSQATLKSNEPFINSFKVSALTEQLAQTIKNVVDNSKKD